MREARKTQPALRENWLEVGHADELRTISQLLDAHPRIEELVAQDLGAASRSSQTPLGAGGLTAEQVVRMLIVKQMNGFSYRELAFHLADSRSYRTFCRLGILDKVPSKRASSSMRKRPGIASMALLHVFPARLTFPIRHTRHNVGPVRLCA